ncbi:hypothetical protein BDW66DRAFT_146906 [Aspergillus desertorum]
MPAQDPFNVRVTFIDSASHFVLIDAKSTQTAVVETISSESSRNVLVKSIRRADAVAMSLAGECRRPARRAARPKLHSCIRPPYPRVVAVVYASRQGVLDGLTSFELLSHRRTDRSGALSYTGTIATGLSPQDVLADGTSHGQHSRSRPA